MPKMIYISGYSFVPPSKLPFVAIYGNTVRRYDENWNQLANFSGIGTGPIQLHTSKESPFVLITSSTSQSLTGVRSAAIRNFTSTISNSLPTNQLAAGYRAGITKEYAAISGPTGPSTATVRRINSVNYDPPSSPALFSLSFQIASVGNSIGYSLSDSMYDKYMILNGDGSTPFRRVDVTTGIETSFAPSGFLLNQPSPNFDGTFISGMADDTSTVATQIVAFHVYNSLGNLVASMPYSNAIASATPRMQGAIWHPTLNELFLRRDDSTGGIDRLGIGLSTIDTFIPPSGYDDVFGLDVSNEHMIVVWGQRAGSSRLLEIINLSSHAVEFSSSDNNWFGSVKFVWGL